MTHRSRRRLLLAWFVIVLMISACSGLAGEPQIVATLPPPTALPVLEPPDEDPDTVLGALLFAENCVRCHGETGAGDGEFVQSGQIQSIPDFTNPAAVQGKSPVDFYRTVTQGRIDKLMPPFPSLSDRERWAVANFVYNLSSGEAVPVPVTTEEPQPAVADEAPSATLTGTIRGQVVNGSAGGSVPDDLTVTLGIFDAQMNEESIQQTIDSEGRYTFIGVPIGVEHAYIVTTTYNGGNYNSEVLFGNPNTPDQSVDLTIYETTSDASALRINAVVTQVDRMQDGLRVLQLFHIRNTTDRVYIQQNASGRHVSVRIPLPPAARFANSNDLNRFRFVGAENAVYDTYAVLPDTEHSFHIIYTLPFERSTDFVQSFDYPVAGPYEVYINDEQVRVDAPGWNDVGQQSLAGVTYSGTGATLDLPPGSSVSYSIRTTSPLLQFNQRTIAILLLAAGGLLVVGALVLFVLDFRQRKNAPQPETLAAPETRIQELMRQIAELDDHYQAGTLQKKAYDRQRQRLKAELTTLMKAQS